MDLWIRPEPLTNLLNYFNLRDRIALYERIGIEFRKVSVPLKGGYEYKGIRKGSSWVISVKDGYEYRANRFGVITLWNPNETYTYTYVRFPLREIPLDEYIWPEVDESYFENLVKIRKLYEDYALVGYTLQTFETAWKLTGFEDFMRMMYSAPRDVEKILDHLLDITLNQAKLLLEAGVDMMYNGDDVGHQTSMIISPSLWRGFLKPRYRKLVDFVHRKGGYLFFHSDGWIEPIIPDLVEIGVDVLHPVQPECMDPHKIKRMYGDKLSFAGCISIQRTIPYGTKGEIEREVRERIANMGPTGYIVAPSHDIQPDASLENIVTFINAANKYRAVG